VSWWSRASIRVRLTVWYMAVLSAMLVVYASATFVAVRHEFREQLEEQQSVAVGRLEPDAESEARMEEQLREILVVLVLGAPLIVILSGAGGYLLARRALAPIDHLGAEARRITAERLHERLTVPNHNDEVGRLAAVFNDTLARLEASFDQLRRFTSDASHELRTPLSVIRGIGELGMRETRSAAEYKDAIGSILEEADRLTRLVDTLLQLSRGDAGTVRLAREAVDLGEVARDVASALGILADDRRQRIDVHDSGDAVVRGDRLVLREAMTNVFDNAIKYGPPGSCIEISVAGSQDSVTVTVTDEGSGIAMEHRPRIFDRFYRVDEGRSRELGGSGLGLAIARWAVTAHGGEIVVEQAGAGSAFRLTIPRTPH
jgi:heavy metal sensor kinase